MPDKEPSKLISHLPRSKEEDDKLFYKDYAEAIYETLGELTPKHTGLTIGIFGSWGSGKSSVLLMIKRLFEDTARTSQFYDDKPIVVFFEAWEYAKEEVPIALLRKIREEARRNISFFHLINVSFYIWRSSIEIKELVLNFIIRVALPIIISIFGLSFIISFISFNDFIEKVVSFLGFTQLSPPPLATVDLLLKILQGAVALFALIGTLWAVMRFLAGGFSKSFRRKLDQGEIYSVELFRREMNDLILAVSRKHPIIVLIDDLDRAPIDQIVPMLEAMKHFGSELDTSSSRRDHCVHAPISFLLAADRVMLQRAIAIHYKDFWQYKGQQEEIEYFTREYLEKIVHIYFDLPPLVPYQLKRLIIDGHNEGNVSKNNITCSLDDAISRAEIIITTAPNATPRQIIQAYNTFIVIWKIVIKRKLDGIEPSLIVALIYMKYALNKFYQCLNRYPALIYDIHSAIETSEDTEEKIEIVEENRLKPLSVDNLLKANLESYPAICKWISQVHLPEPQLISVHIGLEEGFETIYREPFDKRELLKGDKSIIKSLRLFSAFDITFHIEWLCSLVEDENCDLQEKEKAIFALGKTGDSRAFKLLLKIIENRRIHDISLVRRAIFSCMTLFQKLPIEDKDNVSRLLNEILSEDDAKNNDLRIDVIELIYVMDNIFITPSIRKTIIQLALFRDGNISERATEIIKSRRYINELEQEISHSKSSDMHTARFLNIARNIYIQASFIPEQILSKIIDISISGIPQQQDEAILMLSSLEKLTTSIDYLAEVATKAIGQDRGDIFAKVIGLMSERQKSTEEWRDIAWKRVHEMIVDASPDYRFAYQAALRNAKRTEETGIWDEQ